MQRWVLQTEYSEKHSALKCSRFGDVLRYRDLISSVSVWFMSFVSKWFIPFVSKWFISFAAIDLYLFPTITAAEAYQKSNYREWFSLGQNNLPAPLHPPPFLLFSSKVDYLFPQKIPNIDQNTNFENMPFIVRAKSHCIKFVLLQRSNYIKFVLLQKK